MIKFEGDMSAVIKQTAEFFQAYKKKAVFNTVITANPMFIGSNTTSRTIEFYDGRVDPPFKVGKMWWDGDGYTIESPRISNEKFARWNSQYHTKTTGDMNRAVKNALQFIKPFDWKMVADQNGSDVRNGLREWANKPHVRIMEAIKYSVSHNDIFNEIKAALDEGRNFVSDSMNKAKTVVANNFEEATRRQELGLIAMFVAVDQYGRYVSDKWDNPKTEEELHEDVRTKISLLKMMDLNESKTMSERLDEVGIRYGSNTYWVFVNQNVYAELSAKPEA